MTTTSRPYRVGAFGTGRRHHFATYDAAQAFAQKQVDASYAADTWTIVNAVTGERTWVQVSPAVAAERAAKAGA